MVHLMEMAETTLDRTTAFAYVAEFENIEKWDPGVRHSVKRTPGPTGVGTIYDLVLDYNGRAMPMTYTVTTYDPDKMVVLEGQGARVRAIDTITFDPKTGGTLVTYEADLGLTGIAQPFLAGRFKAIGVAAGEGLRTWLGELEELQKR